MLLSRRQLFLLLPSLPLLAVDTSPLITLERQHSGRLGVYAAQLSPSSGLLAAPLLSHRADERFALCSTFKALLAGCVLGAVDRAALSLDEPLRVRRRDLLSNSPLTQSAVDAHGARATMTIRDLCHATMTTSDNAAANLLLARIGGLEPLNAFLRGLGDATTRIDRIEPFMNLVDTAHGDTRDTTTPAAMASSIAALALGGALSEASRGVYVGWLRAAKTGLTRLRASWPSGWEAGDKTGTGPDGPTNDVAVAWPSGRSPLIVTAYFDRPGYTMEQSAAVLAAVGQLLMAQL